MLAFDGYDALKQIKESQLEVVILDNGMPGLTEYEVARAIRKTPSLESASKSLNTPSTYLASAIFTKFTRACLNKNLFPPVAIGKNARPNSPQ